VSLADLHASEGDNARTRSVAELDALRRLLWIQSATGIVIALIVYAQFSRVVSVNRRHSELEPVLRSEPDATVLSFVINHTDQIGYTIRPSEQARTVRQLLVDAAAINGTEGAAPAALGKYTLGELDRLARQRPDGIKLTLPYLDKVDVPLTYPVLALVSAVLGIIGNLFVLLRQRAIGELDGYAERHIHAAEQLHAGETLSRRPPFEVPTAAALWPGAPPRASSLIVQVASGVLQERLANRTATLIEIGAGVVSVVVLVSLFAMGLYLSIEQPLWRESTIQVVALCAIGGALLTAVLSYAAGLLARRLTV
jgi:hypothetical protein